jgi:hypothetical protein
MAKKESKFILISSGLIPRPLRHLKLSPSLITCYLWRGWISFFVLIMLANCAARYIVEVDGYGNDSHLDSKKYVLASGDSTVNESSLQYIEFSDYIKKILYTKGYVETASRDDADLIIFFRYGISDPKIFYRTYYGVNGQEIGTYTEYFRYLTLDVYDLNVYKSTGKPKMVWNTILTSSGRSDDLRLVIPRMIAVGGSYFGKNNETKQSLEILENDPRVEQLKGIEKITY